jgi:hypothetical protein
MGWIFGRKMAILGILMVCEGKYAYEGLSLGIWKVIWVIWNVKNLFWKNSIFRFVRVVYLGEKWLF